MIYPSHVPTSPWMTEHHTEHRLSQVFSVFQVFSIPPQGVPGGISLVTPGAFDCSVWG